MHVPKHIILIASTLLGTAAVTAQSPGIEGNWRTPTGSIISASPCGGDLCLMIKQVEKSAPGTLDHNNPDPKLQSRSLCGIEIGSGFKPADGGKKAEGGHIYDPKSGKTYSASLAADGETLKLRGYIGLKAFGRTEQWTRATGPVETCY